MDDHSSSDDRETVTDQELLKALAQAESPVIATSEIAEKEEIPISQGQVLKRLKSLEEKDRVGSKSYSAKPQVRLWWDKKVEFKEAWTSENEITEEINVEAVDVLDLPGRGEKLRMRREAVNSVFKFTFDVGKASKNELALVGWGADMKTYADRHSLWNNCLKKSLDQSPFHILNKTDKIWLLSNLGEYLKEINNRALWVNWKENKNRIEKQYHSILWATIFEPDIEFTSALAEHRSGIKLKYGESGPILGHMLDMDGSVCFNSTGTLEMFLEVSKEPDKLRTVCESTEYVTANLETDFQVEDFIEEREILRFKCTRQLNIDASTMFRQVEKENYDYYNLIRQLKNISKWEGTTREQLFEVNERVDMLLG